MSDPTAVTQSRAEELKASWRHVTSNWLEFRATWQEAEEWADTFAPDHPEWFAESLSSSRPERRASSEETT